MTRIKEHWTRNKKVYYAFGTGVVLTTVGIVVLNKKPSADTVVQMKELFTVSVKSPRITTILLERAGNSGNLIVDDLTGDTYRSQNLLAKAIGVSAATVSQHLSGKRKTINGKTYTKIAENW